MTISKKEVQIIPATLAHLKNIQQLNKSLFIKEYHEYDKSLNLQGTFGKDGTAYYKKRITKKDGYASVAVINKKVVGYLCGGIKKVGSYRNFSNIAELENMFVLETYRSQGVGAKLYYEFVCWCKKNKIKKLRVQAYAKNIRAIAFYRKNKFTDRSLILESNI